MNTDMAEALLKLLFMLVFAAVPGNVEHNLAEEQLNRKPDLAIHMNAEGQVTCEGKVVDNKALLELLKARKGENEELLVGLKADEKTPFEKYAALLELISDADVGGITFMAEGK